MSEQQKKRQVVEIESQPAQVWMPVDRMSYSAFTQLLRNPLIFKLKYILGIYDVRMSVSGMVGRAAHEALKTYYGGNPEVAVPNDRTEAMHMAIDAGMAYLGEYDDSMIDYGKTGSRESMLKTYSQAMRFYFAEEPEYHEVVMSEQKLESPMVTIDGEEIGLPIVAIPDLVHQRKDGGFEIIDTKFVRAFTDWETEDYIKIVQAQFVWHALKGSKGIVADRMLFREIKVSENKDGGPQVRDYAIPFAHEQYRVIFYNLYRDAMRVLMNPASIYLPNLSDPFDGEQAGLLYAQGLINADMSDVEVMHKVKDVALTSKKFVSSRLDRLENKNLLPEEKIKLRMAEFGIPIEPEETKQGASVTQYRFKVSAGVRMSVFVKHKADIARAIAATGEIRILAPIPGTALVGVEVENEQRGVARLGKGDFHAGTLTLPIGVEVDGRTHYARLDDMPHLLIAGATGSGKSVLIHTILTVLTKQMKPAQMQLILIDPKRVELAAWAGDRHLNGGKIAYEYADAALILKGLIDEMEARYKMLEKAKCRDIGAFNKKIAAGMQLPYVVLVVDEFADLILQGKAAERKRKSTKSLATIVTRERVTQTARRFARMGVTYVPPDPAEEIATVEEMITRLAQMARAVGIHLIIATQRPSVDVITGLIKANFPSRIALTTASATDSKVILGAEGAEKLHGKGDMIFMHPGASTRLQGFLS